MRPNRPEYRLELLGGGRWVVFFGEGEGLCIGAYAEMFTVHSRIRDGGDAAVAIIWPSNRSKVASHRGERGPLGGLRAPECGNSGAGQIEGSRC